MFVIQSVVETTRSHRFIVHGVRSSFGVLMSFCFYPGLQSAIKVCVYNIWCLAFFFSSSSSFLTMHAV